MWRSLPARFLLQGVDRFRNQKPALKTLSVAARERQIRQLQGLSTASDPCNLTNDAASSPISALSILARRGEQTRCGDVCAEQAESDEQHEPEIEGWRRSTALLLRISAHDFTHVEVSIVESAISQIAPGSPAIRVQSAPRR
jgi:hypothetical protein